MQVRQRYASERIGIGSSVATHRELLKSATLAVAASATAASAAPLSSAPAPTPSEPRRLAKIELEEHFLIPEFIDYFETTDPNISPQITKSGLESLQDLGDRRIAIMDGQGIYVQVLSVASPGVRVERDTAVDVKRSKSANDLLARETQKRPRALWWACSSAHAELGGGCQRA